MTNKNTFISKVFYVAMTTNIPYYSSKVKITDENLSKIMSDLSRLICASRDKNQDCVIITTEEVEKIQNAMKYAYSIGIIAGACDTSRFNQANHYANEYDEKYKKDMNARL